MATRYTDIPSTMQVIGAIYVNPNLLDNGKYFFVEEDFCEEFHRILFGSIYNLHVTGVKEINSDTIEDYLSSREKKLAVYKVNNGKEYLEKLRDNVRLTGFDYYYNRMKKMTILRMYNERAGMDLSYLYDKDNILDLKKKQKQEDWLDNNSPAQIAAIIDQKIEKIKIKYLNNQDDTFVQAGVGGEDLIDQLLENPEVGVPLYGPIINNITKGARLGKLYLRSAATGVGKTRSMIADCCNIGCDKIFDSKKDKWVSNGTKEPCVFITTEQQLDEIQTMMFAFLADVDEDHIIDNTYRPGELARVRTAAKLLKDCPIYIKRLPDFNLQDIENTIKFGISEYKARYFFHDYIHSSMKILSEVSGKARVEGLKEYNILFMVAVRLKDLCVEHGVFIETATQLNAEYRISNIYDQNLLRGAKSIADKIDVGSIMLDVTQEDRESLSTLIQNNGFELPSVKISVYKNRRGKYKDILLWCRANKGTCKIEPMFVTDYLYEVIDIPDLKINVIEREN